MTISVSKYIVRYLIHKKVRHVFGYSGGANLPLLNEFYNYRDRIKFIKNSTEICSGLCAEGYSKSRSLHIPGVVVTTSGPGLTNCITPLQNAYSDGSPLVLISCQVPLNSIGTDAFQESNAIELTRACTKWNKQIRHKNEIIESLDIAFNSSMSPRKGPVHIDIPKDILLDEIIVEIIDKKKKPINFLYSNSNYSTQNTQNRIDDFVKRLNSSKCPVIIAGGGCNNSWELLRIISVDYNIPVATTIHGMGVVDENHQLSLGMMGMHGNPAANYAVQSSDMIISIGSRFDDRITGNLREFGRNAIDAGLSGKGGIYHIDSSLTQINKVRKLFNKYHHERITDRFLKSIETTSGHFLKTLLQKSIDKKSDNWIETINRFKNNNPYYYDEDSIKMKGPDVIKCINRRIDEFYLSRENIFFTTGVGNHQMWTCQHITWTHPGRMITSGSLGTMGVGVPFAIGSKFANPHSTVICIDGDSSFTMTLNELQTVLENKIDVKIAILNDSRQQMVHIWQKLFHNENYIATDNKNPNFAIIAKAYGIQTIECYGKRTLEKTVDKFLTLNKPVIAVFHIEPEMCFPLVAPGKPLNEMILHKNDIKKINKRENAPN